jgi:hypothetical protein
MMRARSLLLAAVFANAACGARHHGGALPSTQLPRQSAASAPGTSSAQASATAPPAKEPAAAPALAILQPAGPNATGVVGQLAIVYQGGLVPPDHAFKVGDRIQFLVSSSKAGWIFVYHEAPGQGRSLLWPESEGCNAKSYIEAGGQRLVPSDAAIKFDDEAQAERFYLVIVSKLPDAAKSCAASPQQPKPPKQSKPPKPPKPSTQQEPAGKDGARATPAESTPPPDPIIQIAIRGGVDVKFKGVTLEHFGGGVGTAFHAAPGDDDSIASIEFSLKHVDRSP